MKCLKWTSADRALLRAIDAAATRSQISLSGAHMSAPSRRPEIRRRRTRKEKIVQLRKRLAAAKTDADRSRLTAKLHKLSIMSPGQPLVK
jgi:hypothetical protein